MLSVQVILDFIARWRYAAMFAALFLAAMGVPVPEEVICVASGVAVGVGWADLGPTCLACLAGIVLGDLYIHCLGRFAGPWFLRTRLGRWMLRPERSQRVSGALARNAKKTLFFGRFIPGVRFLVLFYSGQQRMRLGTFLLLDVVAAGIQAPIMILVGRWAGSRLPDAAQATEAGASAVRQGELWALAALGGALAVGALVWWLRRRAQRS